MTQSERIIIEQRLLEKESFKGIGRELGKDHRQPL
ncbi:MAG: helix-turn-helix domain-containing protein [Clostridia bacterium]|nr:helix-turn-helix domain-containing protein [Clostridia bacterium]